MKILVTGAAGFVGSHTVDQLLSEGHEVVGLDNLRTGRLENLKGALDSSRFHFVQEDALKRDALSRITARERLDCIIHLAALVSVQESLSNPDLNFELNVRLTHLVAETAREQGVARLVFASSAAVYGNPAECPVSEAAPTAPMSPYGSAKLASEALLLGYARAYGFSAVCLRYFNIYGPRQDPSSPYSGVISIFANCCASGRPVTIFGDGEQTRDFIHVSDIARANVRAATHRGSESAVLNICTGHPTSLNLLAEVLRQQKGAAPAPQYGPARPADILHSCGDPSLARATLGFEAAIPVEQGLGSITSTFLGQQTQVMENPAR